MILISATHGLKNSFSSVAEMADEEFSRSSAGDDEYEETEDNGIDNEGTLDEEEALGDEDYSDELKDLEEEGEMSIEELRRKYGIPMEEENTNTSCPSTEDESEPGGSGGDELFGSSIVEEEDTEDDKDYAPPDPFKKEIRINELLYQAVIPELNTATADRPSTEPLWSPNEKLSDSTLDAYLKSIIDVRKEIGQKIDPRYNESRDDEDSLCALLRAEYNVDNAIGSFPFPHVNTPVRTVRPDALEWDDGEKDMFEKAMLAHGKNFRLIRDASPLSYRNVGELVQYYYKWKTTDRYKTFRRRQQQPDEDYRQFASAILSSEVTNGSTREEASRERHAHEHWLGAKPQA